MNEEIIKNLKEKLNKLEHDEKIIKALLNVLDNESNKFYIVAFTKKDNKFIYECPICKNKIFQKNFINNETNISCNSCGVNITLNDFINSIYFKYDDFSLSDIIKLIK